MSSVVSIDDVDVDRHSLCVIYAILSRLFLVFFFQAEDGIRDLVRSRGLGDVYKRQPLRRDDGKRIERRYRSHQIDPVAQHRQVGEHPIAVSYTHLTLPTIYSV